MEPTQINVDSIGQSPSNPVEPALAEPIPSAPHNAEADAILKQPEEVRPAPHLNLLEHDGSRLDTLQAPLASSPATAAPVAAVPAPPIAPITPSPTPMATRLPLKHHLPVLLVAALVLTLTGGGAYFVLSKPSNKPIQAPKATPVAIASPAVSPSVLPSATPSGKSAPPPVVAPQTVTAPAVAPTADHPQSVTVQSKSGLWLRSSADSSSRNNIIGWIPNGAQVSVDTVGDFWWHGKYSGQTGYFASKYTQ